MAILNKSERRKEMASAHASIKHDGGYSAHMRKEYFGQGAQNFMQPTCSTFQ